MTTAVTAVICLCIGEAVGYVTGAVLTDNKNKETMEYLWERLRDCTRRIGELESEKKRLEERYGKDHMR